MTKPGTAANGLFLEDLRVGQRFSSGEHTIDAAQIMAFAAQFDPRAFHLDGEAAKATLFGGLAASGWHTAAITMKLLVESGLPAARRRNHRKRRRDQLAQTHAARRRPQRGQRNRRGEPVTLAAGSRHDPRAQRDAQPARRDGADSHSEACGSQTHDRCACNLTPACVRCCDFGHQLCANAACPA